MECIKKEAFTQKLHERVNFIFDLWHVDKIIVPIEGTVQNLEDWF